MNCGNCKKETDNPKFCSRSCAATYTNKTIPKRKRIPQLCKSCGDDITFIVPCGKKSKISFCSKCKKPKDPPLKLVVYNRHHKSSAFAYVRERARQSVKHLPRRCENCGYDKHVEICHIKSISSFSSDTPLSIINASSNLKILCPNCHWEFDNLKVMVRSLELESRS